MEQPEPVKRGRGRPAIGQPRLVRLSDDDYAAALALGSGNLSAGIREALRLARTAADERSDAQTAFEPPTQA